MAVCGTVTASPGIWQRLPKLLQLISGYIKTTSAYQIMQSALGPIEQKLYEAHLLSKISFVQIITFGKESCFEVFQHFSFVLYGKEDSLYMKVLFWEKQAILSVMFPGKTCDIFLMDYGLCCDRQFSSQKMNCLTTLFDFAFICFCLQGPYLYC